MDEIQLVIRLNVLHDCSVLHINSMSEYARSRHNFTLVLTMDIYAILVIDSLPDVSNSAWSW